MEAKEVPNEGTVPACNSSDSLALSEDCSSERSVYDSPPVFVVSSSSGYNAEQRVRIVLAQFPGYEQYPLVKVPNLQSGDQVRSVVKRAAAHGSMVVHTLVQREMRAALGAAARQAGVRHVDLTGELVDGLSEFLGQQPLQEPGRYWAAHKADLDRITAIEFTLAHDDGRRPEDWPLADICILGPSRAGKTPLSVYLGVMGFRVANIPLAPGVALPDALDKVASGRVVGLSIDAETLHAHRRTRELGVKGTPYTDPDAIHQELTEASRLYRRHGYHVVPIKDRALEACADDIVRRVTMVSNMPRRSSGHALAELEAAEKERSTRGGRIDLSALI